jgi:hypothetical protein
MRVDGDTAEASTASALPPACPAGVVAQQRGDAGHDDAGDCHASSGPPVSWASSIQSQGPQARAPVPAAGVPAPGSSKTPSCTPGMSTSCSWPWRHLKGPRQGETDLQPLRPLRRRSPTVGTASSCCPAGNEPASPCPARNGSPSSPAPTPATSPWTASGRRGERVVGDRLWHTPRLRDPGTRPAAGGPSEHAGKLAFREGIASLNAQSVSGHRLVVDGICLGHLIIIVLVGSGTRARGWLTHRSWRLTRCLALALATLSFLSRGGWKRTHESAAGRPVPVGLCRRSLF